MQSLPCDYDLDEEADAVDLVDLLRRSIELAQGRRHLNAVATSPTDQKEEAPMYINDHLCSGRFCSICFERAQPPHARASGPRDKKKGSR